MSAVIVEGVELPLSDRLADKIEARLAALRVHQALADNCDGIGDVCLLSTLLVTEISLALADLAKEDGIDISPASFAKYIGDGAAGAVGVVLLERAIRAATPKPPVVA